MDTKTKMEWKQLGPEFYKSGQLVIFRRQAKRHGDNKWELFRIMVRGSNRSLGKFATANEAKEHAAQL